jgi:hypothetical protein
MSPRSSSNHLWSIILAGGEGTRLKSLTIRSTTSGRKAQVSHIEQSTKQQPVKSATFVIDRASVQWVRSHECDLAAGEVCAGVKWRIDPLQRKRIELGP